jgi:hypothetical protein
MKEMPSLVGRNLLERNLGRDMKVTLQARSQMNCLQDKVHASWGGIEGHSHLSMTPDSSVTFPCTVPCRGTAHCLPMLFYASKPLLVLFISLRTLQPLVGLSRLGKFLLP